MSADDPAVRLAPRDIRPLSAFPKALNEDDE
jgi:hypothetical protein